MKSCIGVWNFLVDNSLFINDIVFFMSFYVGILEVNQGLKKIEKRRNMDSGFNLDVAKLPNLILTNIGSTKNYAIRFF